MALTGLLAAEALYDERHPGALTALTVVAGSTLLERQADQLIAVGIERLFVQVAALPNTLVAAIDRLRARGIAISPVRSLADLSATLLPDDTLIMVADGLHARPMHYRAIADAAAPTILVTADTSLTQHLERVDASARWAGLASLKGTDIADLAAMPGEWDVMLTLFRRAVQSSPRRLACEPALFGAGEIAIVTDPAMIPALEARALQTGASEAMGLGTRWLFMPLARILGAWLVGHPTVGRVLPGVALGFLALAAAAPVMGYAALSPGFAVVAAAVLAGMRFLASFRVASDRSERAGMVGETLLILLVAALPWLIAWGGSGSALPPVLLAALAATLALTLFAARAVAGMVGRRRRFPWLLPDAEQVWLMLLAAMPFGLFEPAIAAIAVAAAGQVLGWLRLIRPGRAASGNGV